VKRATIDTNVFVSGLLFGGLPLKILRAALEKKFILVTSPDLMNEIEKVLSSKKFELSAREISVLTRPLFDQAELIIPALKLSVIERCPADNRVLECAVEGKCDTIVSGDRRDLVSLKSFQEIVILTPRQFYEKLS
jgi:putative PIN family toxin of toxin-antitoxin system